MRTLASWPSWMVFIIVMATIGPVMRMIFGGRGHFPRGRLKDRYTGLLGERDRLISADVERLETAIAERDTVLDDLQQRVSEMESRLDFAERMLARPQESSANKAAG